MHDEMHIGQLAEQFGLNPKTLRYYEAIGLLPPPRRTESGYRVYDAAAAQRLGFIQRAKLLGLSLADIGEIIAAQSRGEQPCARVLALVTTEIADIDRRIAELKTFRAELAALHAAWSDTTARRNDSACLCPIIETQAEVDAPPPVAETFDQIVPRRMAARR